MNNITVEKLKKALTKDLKALYTLGFTAEYEADRIIRSAEIKVMEFTNLQEFIEKNFTPKE